ncbi:Rrf2 family transcriptional regulator [Caballeronia sp. INSB1]|uniref:Rrf2 family transcriptional regulator n=1 Tax=Caballeronia sp. INSB1 TaxID=2921751 RepID=UPI002032A0F1|nr:Rrf2 family transcriptional regulator [Caballeronia sp. INSB1]
MRLTHYADYALRVLLYLAIRPSCLSTIEEIASAYGISKGHLTKVVNQLSNLGWVETVRGRSGGLRLATNLGGLTIGAIVRNTENGFALAQCFSSDSGSTVCAIDPRCNLKNVFAAARDAFLAELDKFQVVELAQPANELGGLLNITAPGPVKLYALVRNDTIG